MLANDAIKGFSGALLPPPTDIPDVTHILPAAGIYGSNAAGKSNIVKAMGFMREAVTSSQARWSPQHGIDTDPHFLRVDEDSRFEVELVQAGVRYRYGFSAKRTHIVDEWLYSYPKKRERLLFKRNTSSNFETSLEFGPHFAGDERDHRSTQRRTRHNSLYISASAQDNQPDCLAVSHWFDKRVEIEKRHWDIDDYGFTNHLCFTSERVKSEILGMVRAADPNISDIVIERTDSTPETADLAELELSEATMQFVADNRRYKVSFAYGVGDERFLVPLHEQSDGTKHLYGLAAVLTSALMLGDVIFIDEIESSLHTHITSQVISLFQSRVTNKVGAQLIFTTHDTNLLSADILRRDQIWFVEKDYKSSHLYSLLEFKPRNDENYETNYLRGRYGAVPHLGLIAGFAKDFG